MRGGRGHRNFPDIASLIRATAQNPTALPCRSYASARSIFTVAISPTRRGRRLAHVSADQPELLIRIAPPFAHVRPSEPVAHKRQVGGRHRTEMVAFGHSLQFS